MKSMLKEGKLNFISIYTGFRVENCYKQKILQYWCQKINMQTLCFIVNFYVHVLHFVCIQQLPIYYVQGLPTKDGIIKDDLNLLKYNTYKVN